MQTEYNELTIKSKNLEQQNEKLMKVVEYLNDSLNKAKEFENK